MAPEAQGRRIRIWLKIIGWDDKQLGDQIGEGKSQVSKILNGERKERISQDQLWRIALVTGAPLLYFMYGDRREVPPDKLKLLPPED